MWGEYRREGLSESGVCGGVWERGGGVRASHGRGCGLGCVEVLRRNLTTRCQKRENARFQNLYAPPPEGNQTGGRGSDVERDLQRVAGRRDMGVGV